MPKSYPAPSLEPRELRRVVTAAAVGNIIDRRRARVWASTHNLGQALAYSIAVPAVALVLSILLMPETRGMRIWGASETTP